MYRDNGPIIKISITADNLGYNPQSEYNTFPLILCKAEETTENYKIILADLVVQVPLIA